MNLLKGIQVGDRVFLKRVRVPGGLVGLGAIGTVTGKRKTNVGIGGEVQVRFDADGITYSVLANQLRFWVDEGPDHRILKDSEEVREGDEYINLGANTPQWKPVGSWNTQPPFLTVGHRRKNTLSNPRAAFTLQFRRRVAKPAPLTAPPAKPAPRRSSRPAPAGYRVLEEGETILETDRYIRSNGTLTHWAAHCTGGKVGDHPGDLDSMPWVRAVASPAPAPRSPEGQPPAGYRWLVEGEFVEKGDRVYHVDENVFRSPISDYTGHVVGTAMMDLTSYPFVRAIAAVKPSNPKTKKTALSGGFRAITINRDSPGSAEVTLTNSRGMDTLTVRFSNDTLDALAQLIVDTKQ